MPHTCVSGSWSFLPNQEFLNAPDRMLFDGPIYWAEKVNGVRVSRGPFRLGDALGFFTYNGPGFSLDFSVYPIIAYWQRNLEEDQRRIEWYSKIEETRVAINERSVAGALDRDAIAELLSDIKDSCLYDCLFDCPADYWPPGTLNYQGFESLYRAVENCVVDPQSVALLEQLALQS